LIVPDTSVLVPGFTAAHPFYSVAEPALIEIRRKGGLAAHTMAEAYSVLSAPGGVYRAEPELVLEYLKELLGDSSPIQPRPESYREALEFLAGEGRGGAPVFDALIALAVRDAEATLVSLDRRARPTYELCGVEFRFLDEG
jgi:predicted nucleic acid-binding protein